MLTPVSPHTRAYSRTANRLGWALVLFLGLFYVLNLSVDILFYDGTDTAVSTVVYGLLSSVTYMAPFIIGGIFFYVFSRGEQTERIHFEVKLPPTFPLMILAGLAVITAASYVNGWFCDAIGYEIPADLPVQDYSDPSAVIMYMTVALAPAFSEEFLFRGVIYGNLRPYGRTQAILISSLLFALMHQNIGQTFYTFVAGIAMALMYELTGSIWCSIFFHMLNNELSVLTEILYYGKFGESFAPYLYLSDILILALGAISILILILYYGRKAKEDGSEIRMNGLFGRSGTESAEKFDTPLAASTVTRLVCAPGMLVFVIMALMSTLFTYLAVLVSGGGW